MYRWEHLQKILSFLTLPANIFFVWYRNSKTYDDFILTLTFLVARCFVFDQQGYLIIHPDFVNKASENPEWVHLSFKVRNGSTSVACLKANFRLQRVTKFCTWCHYRACHTILYTRWVQRCRPTVFKSFLSVSISNIRTLCNKGEGGGPFQFFLSL